MATTRNAMVPARLVQQGSDLLHEQCWCWGQDIRSPLGNLLVTHGFERRRPPSGDHGTATCYVVTTASGATVRLWGFGMVYAPRGGAAVFAGRYRFAPTPLPQDSLMNGIWCASEIPTPTLPAAVPSPAWWTMVGAMRWLAGYERWVRRTAGDDWRRTCTKGWRDAVVDGRHLHAAWSDLADAVESSVLAHAMAPAHVTARQVVQGRPV